jgi:hypothetical protein
MILLRIMQIHTLTGIFSMTKLPVKLAAPKPTELYFNK